MNVRVFAGLAAGLCILIVPAVRDVETQSAPTVGSVSGNVAHDGSVVVSGSSFGSKPAAAPVKFDNFQNLAVGQNLNANGWKTAGYHPPVAANSLLRQGTPFTKNAHAFFESNISFSAGGDSSNFYLTDLNTTKYYLDFWHYITTDSDPQPENIKPWRLHQANAGAPNIYFGFAGPSAGDTVFGTDGTDSNVSGYFGSNDNGVAIPLTGSDWYNNWQHMLVMIDVGTPGSPNGSVVAYVNGKLRMNYNRNVIVLAGGYSNFPELWLGNYVRSDPHGNTHAYWDSVYVDSSWARVEVGNAASYAACTHRETQIPTSWSGNSLSVRLNRGSFSSFNGTYLFVIDSTGNASAGYPLSGSGGGPVGGSPAATPTNLRIIS
jgi:hypothetical protein